MSVDSTTEKQDTGELASLQNRHDNEQVAYVDTVADEIETVIDEASALQDYDYVIGEVSDYGVSKNDHAHFKLTHQGGPLHCVLFASRRSRITTDIEDGMQLAVSGNISFFAPDNRCSIEVEEIDHITADGSQQSSMVPTERRQLLLLAMVILIVLVIGSALILL